jgi:hypothetical protein
MFGRVLPFYEYLKLHAEFVWKEKDYRVPIEPVL